MEAAVLDLRRKMPDVLAAIDRQERVILAHRGKRKAVIVPFANTGTTGVKVAELEAFGMWSDREDMTGAVSYVENLRKDRVRNPLCQGCYYKNKSILILPWI